MPLLFDAKDADGQSSTLVWRGGRATFSAFGAFEGTTCKLQVSFDRENTWLDVGNEATFTADGLVNFEFGNGALLRADLSGTGSPSPSVTAKIT